MVYRNTVIKSEEQSGYPIGTLSQPKVTYNPLQDILCAPMLADCRPTGHGLFRDQVFNGILAAIPTAG